MRVSVATERTKRSYNTSAFQDEDDAGFGKGRIIYLEDGQEMMKIMVA
jgi:hypothetical protein